MEKTIPYGLCHCGCGEKTNISPRTYTAKGLFKGEPARYIHNHHTRKSPELWRCEDRGYATPCWIWQRATSKAGHAIMQAEGRVRYVHRLYYERAYGPIPRGFHAHHLCEVKACVNPDHIRPLTQSAHHSLHQKHKGHKLTIEEVEQIHTLWQSGGITHKAIAARYGVRRQTVSKILSGKLWKGAEPNLKWRRRDSAPRRPEGRK